ncbi:phage portal protein [Streptomyces sp. ME19-01-6]|uniref:phage portal protein n=1 Tax=Streptomyces sp. ME19-01-6 TaxID=3028686 RepID=UPI0029B28B9C|nr:phage portal protein [Streptomyces sp. ME19-01-6]MDX3230621.1 phage portal protein [Streptomyces sp. ME19-01-6]
MGADTMDLMYGIEELDAARPDYRKAQQFYDGDVPEIFASARLRRALEDTGTDFRLNFAKTPVDAVVDRLEIAAITGADDAHTKLISTMWADNGMDLEAPDIHRHACTLGDAYLIVLPVEDDREQVIGVEMHYNSPETVRAIYSEENPREIEYVIKRWCETRTLGKVHRAELYYDDRVERWTTKPGSTGDQVSDWIHWLAEPEDGQEPDEDSWIITHDWGRPPVFHFRTGRPYGRPEHIGGYGPQNAINKLSITHMGTVDYQGFPQRYALTDAATTDTSDLEPGDWDDFPPDDHATGPTDSGDDSSLKAGPGEVWTLRGFKAVGQFDAANPSVFLDPVMFEVRAMAQITTTPLHLFDPQGEVPSGESIRAKEAPFVKKIRNRQMSFGATWREVFVFALNLLGIGDATVDVRWAPAATVEDQTGWQTATEKVKNGVPRRQVLLESGYREEQVDEWLEGVDDAELARRVDILATVADSAQKLGAAAALGVVTSEQVQALLTGALSDIELLAGVEART